MLEEVKADCPCPVSLATIKNYVTILIPAYLFNIGLQRHSATFAEVIPSILRAISDWEIIKVKIFKTGQQLCQCLIDELKTRFDYELNSHLYQVSNYILISNYECLKLTRLNFAKAASVLRVSFLTDWAPLEPFGINHYNLGVKALESETCLNLFKKTVKEKPNDVASKNKVYEKDSSDIAELNSRKFYSNFHQDEKNTQKLKQLKNDNILLIQIQNEVSIFRKLLIDEDMLSDDCISKRRFWLKFKSHFLIYSF